MALSRKAAERVLGRIAEETDLLAHFRRTIVPDEAFFQTILCAEPDLMVADGNFRYEKWRGNATSHPETLSREDVSSAVRSGMHFGRKFVEKTDPAVLDEVDRYRLAG